MKTEIRETQINIQSGINFGHKIAFALSLLTLISSAILYFSAQQNQNLDLTYVSYIIGGVSIFSLFLVTTLLKSTYRNNITINSNGDIKIQESKALGTIPAGDIHSILVHRTVSYSAGGGTSRGTHKSVTILVKLVRHFGSNIIVSSTSKFPHAIITKLTEIYKIPITMFSSDDTGRKKFFESMEEFKAKEITIDDIPNVQNNKALQTSFSAQIPQNPSFNFTQDGGLTWRPPIFKSFIFFLLSIALTITGYFLIPIIAIFPYILFFFAVLFLYASFMSFFTTYILKLQNYKIVTSLKSFGKEKNQGEIEYQEIKAIPSDLNNSKSKEISIMNQKGGTSWMDFKNFLVISTESWSAVEKLYLEKEILKRIT